MDDLDRRIITELQENFPLEINPYEMIAETIGIDVDQLWERILNWVDAGVIRRMGFSIDSRKMGYSSTLTAIRVSPDRVEGASAVIEKYPEITHSYLRDDEFNIWFTVIAESTESVCSILEKVRTELGLSESDMMNLPVEKLFKLDARFK